MKMNHYFFAAILFVWVLLPSNASAQKDFNNYKILLSEGPIPDDFVIKSSIKVEQDRSDNDLAMKKADEKVFFENIHFGIDELLHSGSVIYGDDISQYLGKIADQLLKKDKELRKKLRFYTIKSNESNAFSTEQGMIFVTTGLISQLTNEAQLAFVLAHEIIHYQEHHVIESFRFQSSSKGLSDQIRQMATYSKEKEFEADKKGIELYKEAGYGSEYLSGIFDVLQYSYLPIDEVRFTPSYYNSKLCYIPDSLHTLTDHPITVDEDYDDESHSHPNILKRKTAVNEMIEKSGEFGKYQHLFGERKFKMIRNIARFERVRSDVINADFGDALYTIYILEKDFPNSLYLNRMKAHCFVSMTSHMNNPDHKKALKVNISKLEGEGARMQQFISKLSAKELATLSMRNVEDIRSAFPDDDEIQLLWNKMVKQFLNTEELNFSDFSELSYYDALEEAKKNKPATSEASNEEPKERTKYETIRKKRSNDMSDGFNNNLYYLYSLSDLVNYQPFLDLKKQIETEKEELDELIKKYESLSDRKKKKINKQIVKNSNKTDLSSFLLYQPYGIKQKGYQVNFTKSEQMAENLEVAINNASEKLDFKVQNITRSNLGNTGTETFNEMAVFSSLLLQIVENQDQALTPVDYSQLQDIYTRYGSAKLAFALAEHSFSPTMGKSYLAAIFAPIMLPTFVTTDLLSGHQLTVAFFVVDINEGTVDSANAYLFKNKYTKAALTSNMYRVLAEMHLKD